MNNNFYCQKRTCKEEDQRASNCDHELLDTGKFDDLYVYLKCSKCGEEIAEDRSDYEDGRYYWTDPNNDDE